MGVRGGVCVPRESLVTLPEVSWGAQLCCPSSCQERASRALVPGTRQPLGLDSHFPTVPETPFLLPHPSHDSVLRNVPGAKGEASQEMNARSLCSCSFQRDRATFVSALPTRGLNHVLPDSTRCIQPGLPACGHPDGQAPRRGSLRPPRSSVGAPKVPATAPSPFTHSLGTGSLESLERGQGELRRTRRGVDRPLTRFQPGPPVPGRAQGLQPPCLCPIRARSIYQKPRLRLHTQPPGLGAPLASNQKLS